MRVSMAAIIQQTERKFNLDEADGVSRRHRQNRHQHRHHHETGRCVRGPSLSQQASRPADVQFGKLTMPRCAVMSCEKNRGVARDTVRRREPA